MDPARDIKLRQGISVLHTGIGPLVLRPAIPPSPMILGTTLVNGLSRQRPGADMSSSITRCTPTNSIPLTATISQALQYVIVTIGDRFFADGSSLTNGNKHSVGLQAPTTRMLSHKTTLSTRQLQTTVKVSAT